MERYCFGVDVGGTTIKLGLFQEKGILVEKWEIPTNKESHGAYILNDINKTLKMKVEEKNIHKDSVIGIGLGVPGPVDKKGVVHRCVNLGWGVFNVQKALENLSGFPVRVGNDANVAALGEMWQGGAKGYHNLLLITLGTGVGGGVIVNGKILHGATGSAGEVGHMCMVFENGAPCSCGKTGCLETVASATGLVRETKAYLDRVETPSILRDQEITAKSIFEALEQKDKVAIHMVEQLGRYLGIATAHMASTLNPEVFVIGGGVSKAGQVLIDTIQKYYKIYAFHSMQDTEFRLASLGNDAGIMGGAKLIVDTGL